MEERKRLYEDASDRDLLKLVEGSVKLPGRERPMYVYPIYAEMAIRIGCFKDYLRAAEDGFVSREMCRFQSVIFRRFANAYEVGRVINNEA